MKRIGLAILCSALATSVLAAPKDCEELKKEIEIKIQANAVPSYTLEIVSKEEADKHDAAMVVGKCDYGRKAVIYQKNSN
ncbi:MULTISPECIES: DUF1161 domain-containing protein [Pseudomonas]|uniref:DUF1161 domain-containing protein n=1 Tax=Pseudomonas TaxID=286 RepID=UPI000CD4A8B3|nr:DUF1161 domain-containing protein [Pseudomonas sp. MWU12-2020]RBB98593.1 DUF1161 domain-containing protein [Pseudomonas sp. MWU12-2115]RBL69628.1 DUF1161 domain-containing protein [Pseudomonas sp. MWU13-2625]